MSFQGKRKFPKKYIENRILYIPQKSFFAYSLAGGHENPSKKPSDSKCLWKPPYAILMRGALHAKACFHAMAKPIAGVIGNLFLSGPGPGARLGSRGSGAVPSAAFFEVALWTTYIRAGGLPQA